MSVEKGPTNNDRTKEHFMSVVEGHEIDTRLPEDGATDEDWQNFRKDISREASRLISQEGYKTNAYPIRQELSDDLSEQGKMHKSKGNRLKGEFFVAVAAELLKDERS